MRRYRITLEGRAFDVEVLDDPRQERVRVQVDGEVFTVRVRAVAEDTPAVAAADPAVTAAPLPAPATHRTVKAPLPGVIKSIAVRPGQQVAPDDKLLVIEAMKMDNVIRATRVGSIGTIYVAEGRQVAYGEPLLEMNNEWN